MPKSGHPLVGNGFRGYSNNCLCSIATYSSRGHQLGRGHGRSSWGRGSHGVAVVDRMYIPDGRVVNGQVPVLDVFRSRSVPATREESYTRERTVNILAVLSCKEPVRQNRSIPIVCNKSSTYIGEKPCSAVCYNKYQIV